MFCTAKSAKKLTFFSAAILDHFQTKHRRSDKWLKINENVISLVKIAKQKCYANFVEDLKGSNEGQWYEKFKNISRFDKQMQESIIVNEISFFFVNDISEHTDQEQVKLIADNF